MVPRDQPIIFRLRDELQSKERFEVVGGKGEPMLITQDHNSNEMLETGRIQLAYRYFKTIKHKDDVLRNRE